MARDTPNNWLDRPVDESSDHVLGSPKAEITLVEYGSYACPYCRAANEQIAEVRDRFGERLRYVFRHRPITGSDIARRAAELVERADDPRRFWEAHIALMTRSHELTEDDLLEVANTLGLPDEQTPEAQATALRAKARVEADEASARASEVLITPTFFINARRYDGAWDDASLADAMLGRLGHRVRSAALDFASWAPSTGVLLLIATALAIALTNMTGFAAFWEQTMSVGISGAEFRMSLLHWINDGLLTLFFLVIGLEVKREFTVGHLASLRSAALPIAAAIGGMAVPALVYYLAIPGGALSGAIPGAVWAHGWGVPITTDTAFAIALIVMLGSRVPVELRIFLTAAAIVDDIGAIVVVAIFYSGGLDMRYLAGAAAITAALALLNAWRVYSVAPYAMLGVVLWACVRGAGLDPTLAGVILALFIPTRPPPNLTALTVQANTILSAEAEHSGEVLRHGPSAPALRALDAIRDRLESPADRLLRRAAAPSSYIVLPLFALANAGVAISGEIMQGRERLMLAIVGGLVIGKPLGLTLASALAVRLGVAVKSDAYSWLQVLGAGALAGIGFTMSLYIAGQAFPVENDFAAAKIAVLAASTISAIVGVALLWVASRRPADAPAD